MLIEGVLAAVTTPFYPDEKVYFRKIEANMARYSRTLLAGMVVLGSTGEAVMLEDAESREVLRTAVAAAAPEKVLVAGVSRESVRATQALAEAAADYGYDAVLIRTPAYYAAQMTSARVLHYFRCVADRSPLPVLLYNFPQCVRYEIPVDLVVELAQHPNIVGIKESGGSVERLRAVLAATRNAPKRTVTVTPIFEAVTGRMLSAAEQANRHESESLVPAEILAESAHGDEPRKGSGASVAATLPALNTRTREVGFQVLTGSAGNLLQALELGASGGILAAADYAPQACQEVYLAWKDHDLQLATEKQAALAIVNRRVSALGLAGIKYACDWNGYYGGPARSPMVGLTAAEKAEVEEALSAIRN